jgi:hypothetical protein
VDFEIPPKAGDSTKEQREDEGRAPKAIEELDLSVLPEAQSNTILALFKQLLAEFPPWQTLSEQLLTIVDALRDRKPDLIANHRMQI